SRTPVITARTLVINSSCRECCVSATKEPGEKRVEVIKGYTDPRQLLGRSELEGKRGRFHRPSIPVWRAVRILDHNNVKWKTFTVVLG
ncbi:hypothetical protein ALC62_06090, partial [Cyphomyrmex costatus]